MGIPISVKISWVGAKYLIKLEQPADSTLGRGRHLQAPGVGTGGTHRNCCDIANLEGGALRRRSALAMPCAVP